MTFRIPFIVILATLVAAGCEDTTPLADATAETSHAQDQRTLPTKTFAGQVTIDNLPSHYGLTVSLAFFPVDGPDAEVPFDGDPPGDVVTDCPEIYSNIDLENECADPTRNIPFSVEHGSGYYYIQLRTLLYRKQKDKVFAQAEQFFFGRRPLELLADLPAVTLPVEWPSIPLDELGQYGTVEPNKANDKDVNRSTHSRGN